jgi:hypothetical protein
MHGVQAAWWLCHAEKAGWGRGTCRQGTFASSQIITHPSLNITITLSAHKAHGTSVQLRNVGSTDHAEHSGEDLKKHRFNISLQRFTASSRIREPCQGCNAALLEARPITHPSCHPLAAMLPLEQHGSAQAADHMQAALAS